MKMPIRFQPLILSMVLTLSPVFALAIDGGAGPGGGDRCEERFKVIAQDLRNWILKDGAKGLKLDASTVAVSPEEYSLKMIEQIGKAQITCVGPHDGGYPVLVNGHPKECKNFVDQDGISRIVCDREKFYSGVRKPENDPSQYQLVHHEYATLAGFEVPMKEDSHYPLSDQITGFLEDTTVKKLVVKSAVPVSCNAILKKITDVKFKNCKRISISNRPGGKTSKDLVNLEVANDSGKPYRGQKELEYRFEIVNTTNVRVWQRGGLKFKIDAARNIIGNADRDGKLNCPDENHLKASSPFDDPSDSYYRDENRQSRLSLELTENSFKYDEKGPGDDVGGDTTFETHIVCAIPVKK